MVRVLALLSIKPSTDNAFVGSLIWRLREKQADGPSSSSARSSRHYRLVVKMRLGRTGFPTMNLRNNGSARQQRLKPLSLKIQLIRMRNMAVVRRRVRGHPALLPVGSTAQSATYRVPFYMGLGTVFLSVGCARQCGNMVQVNFRKGIEISWLRMRIIIVSN